MASADVHKRWPLHYACANACRIHLGYEEFGGLLSCGDLGVQGLGFGVVCQISGFRELLAA